MNAHKSARERVPEAFADSGLLHQDVKRKVEEESKKQTEQSTKFMESLTEEAREHGQSRMLAGKIVHEKMVKAEELAQLGILDGNMASEIKHHLQHERSVVRSATYSR